jgi:hypothetical protein
VDSSYATSTKQFFDPQGGSLPDFGGFIQPIMFASKLFLAYVSYTSFGSDPGTVKIYRASANDASTLVEDINVLTAVISGPNGGPIPNHHCYPGQPYLFKTNGIDNDLYWPFYAPPVSGNSGHGFLLKRNAAGTWFVVVIDVPFAGPALSFSIQA